jgi:peptidoglycan hydrolase-like protein with peptidoglycan-binding domain
MTNPVGGSTSSQSILQRARDQAIAARTEANNLNAAEKDGNNTVSSEAVAQMLRDQLIFDGMPQQEIADAEAQIDRIIAESDTNGDGEFDAAEFEALYANHMTPTGARVASLTRQEKPWPLQPEVQDMQGGLNEQLAAAGITLPPGDYPPGPPIAVDGKFGPQTEAAVKALQEHWGMEPTGVADAAFLAQLGNGGEALAGIETSANGPVEDAVATLTEGLEQEVPEAFLNEYGEFDAEAYEAAKAHWDEMEEALKTLPADHPQRAEFEDKLAAKQTELQEAYTDSTDRAEQTVKNNERMMESAMEWLEARPLDYAAIKATMEDLKGKLPPAMFEQLTNKLSEAVMDAMEPRDRRGNTNDDMRYRAARDLVESGLPLDLLSPEALVQVADNIVIKHDGDRTDRTHGPAEQLKQVASALLAQGPEGQAALENWAQGLSGIELNRFIDFMAAEGNSTNSPALLSQLSVGMLTHLQNSSHDGKNDKTENIEAALQVAAAREAAEQTASASSSTGGGGGSVHVR